MTEVGQVIFRYAEEIFGLGRELQDVLKGRPQGRPLRLVVGVSDLVTEDDRLSNSATGNGDV